MKKSKELFTKIKEIYKIDLTEDVYNIVESTLLNFYRSDLWQIIPAVLNELQKGIRTSQLCEYLQKEVRKHLRSDIDTSPKYIKNLMRQRKIFKADSTPEKERKLQIVIKAISQYRTKLKEPPLCRTYTKLIVSVSYIPASCLLSIRCRLFQYAQIAYVISTGNIIL